MARAWHRRTQRELASAAGISVATVRNVEKGHGASLRTLSRLAAALGREDWLRSFWVAGTPAEGRERSAVELLDVLLLADALPRDVFDPIQPPFRELVGVAG